MKTTPQTSSCCGATLPSSALSRSTTLPAADRPLAAGAAGGDLPVVVIGAGPVGLAAAAELLQRGLRPLVVEAGARIGANVREWGHVRMFSPWRFNLAEAGIRLLAGSGWTSPEPEDFPTGAELVEKYLEPLAATPDLAPHIWLGARVVGVARRGFDKVKTAGRGERPFLVAIEKADGEELQIEARAVIDAGGTWSKPSPAGASGLPAAGELQAPIAYGIPDVLGAQRERYAGKRVLVVGAGHSAMNALLDLARLAEAEPQTRIYWTIRGEQPRYGGGRQDALPARGDLGARLAALVEAGRIELLNEFHIERFQLNGGMVVHGSRGGKAFTTTVLDEVIVATGLRPDLSYLGELRLELDPALESPRTLAPLIDPNVHSCGSVPPHGEAELRQPEPGFYIVGMKSYGRAPTFLLATGYEQVRSVVAHLAGDFAAAADVRLVLPETGVCSSSARPAGLTARVNG